MIQINQVKKQFDQKIALNIAGLSINEGECVGIVGNNGAGKTTLFRALLDLIRLDEGSIELDGHSVAQSDHWKGILNPFIDESFLIEFLKPIEYLQFIGNTMGLNDKQVQQYLTEMELLVNEDIMQNKKLIRDLSTGSKVRVGLLAAFLGNPKYILLDEPFAHLDPSSQSRLRKVIRTMHASGKTVILSSHNLQNVMEVCSRVILIEAGKVVADHEVTESAIAELNAYFEV